MAMVSVMTPDSKAGRAMRILLRRRQRQDYLQPSGSWGSSRETAREFTHSTVAYYWALEQRLLGVEVLLAFDDPQYDIVAMRVR